MNDTIAAIIIDDEISARNTLKKFLALHCPEVIVVGECSSVKEGFHYLTTNIDPDLVFLDIHLNDGDGFDLLQMVHQINFEIIFITGYDNYAIKAIKYAALDYLVKPIVTEELTDAIGKLIKRKLSKNIFPGNDKLVQSSAYKYPSPMAGKIAVADSDGVRVISLEKIIYCKAEGNYTLFVMSANENILVCKSLKEYEKQLSSHHFLRIHNSYLINIGHVRLYIRGRGGHVEMSNNDCLDVARSRKQILMDILMPQ